MLNTFPLLPVVFAVLQPPATFDHAFGMGLKSLFVSTLLFALSQAVVETQNFTIYWMLKLGYIFVALLIGMGLTSLWEEFAIFAAIKRKRPSGNFLVPVFRANYIAFFVILSVVAIEMLPKRLHSHGFLAMFHNLLTGVAG